MGRNMSKVIDEYDGPWIECWQCGGEGRINAGCIDYACLDQDDPDCLYCSRRCDVCHGKGGWSDEDVSAPTHGGGNG